MKNIKFIKVDLSLFDGEGAAASGDNGTASVAGEQSGEQATNNGSQSEMQNNASSPDAAGSDGAKNAPATLEERKKAYQELIKEYHDLYVEDTQRIIDKRFAETRGLQEQLNELRPVMDLLSQKYNVDDPQGIMKALEDDDSLWENAAYEAGMSVDQYKKFKSLERENNAFKEMQRQAEKDQRTRQMVMDWQQQAAELKEEYPDFDIEYELKNTPGFKGMLKNGVPVRHAFEVAHFDEIKNAMMSYTAQKTAKAVTDNIRAKGQRPLENGTSSQNAFTVQSDVTKLTAKDRADAAKRALRGERISY